MRASILFAAALSVLPAAAFADGGALTLYGGFRGGGSFADSTSPAGSACPQTAPVAR